MNRRFALILFFAFCLSLGLSANPRNIVYSFGQYMTDWCNTNDITYRKKIEELCSGKKSCRVEDKIHADYQRQRGFTGNYETYVLDSYLNMFQTLMSSGVRFSLSNIVVETQDKYPDGQTLTFITADVKVSGKINCSVKDLFLVRDDKISGIYTYSSKYGFNHLNGSLIKELERGRYTYASWLNDKYIEIGYFLGNGKYQVGIIDRYGNITTPCIMRYLDLGNATNFPDVPDSFVGCMEINDADVSQIIDLRTGKVAPFRWCEHTQFSEDMIVVQEKGEGSKGKYGYLRRDDLTYSDVNFLYDYATAFRNGQAYVSIDGRQMIIDKNFKILLEKSNSDYYFSSDYFNSRDCNNPNLFIVYNNKRKYGLANLNGKLAASCIYDKLYPQPHGFFVAKYNNKYCILNEKGEKVSPFIDSEDVPVYKYGLIQVEHEVNERSYIGFLDLDGNIAIPFDTNIEYGPAEQYNINGKDVVFIKASKYETPWINKEYDTLIGADGKPLPGFSRKFQGLGDFDPETGLMSVCINDKYGFINLKGEIVIQPAYDIALDFVNGYAPVTKKVNGKTLWGCINSYGDLIFPCQYDSSVRFNNGIALVKKDGKIGLIDVYGNSYYLK